MSKAFLLICIVAALASKVAKVAAQSMAEFDGLVTHHLESCLRRLKELDVVLACSLVIKEAQLVVVEHHFDGPGQEVTMLLLVAAKYLSTNVDKQSLGNSICLQEGSHSLEHDENVAHMVDVREAIRQPSLISSRKWEKMCEYTHLAWNLIDEEKMGMLL